MSSPKKTIDMKKVTTLSIECGNKDLKKLTISIDDNLDAGRIAYDFCKKNNLDYESMAMLTNKIKTIQSEFINSLNYHNNNRNSNRDNSKKFTHNNFRTSNENGALSNKDYSKILNDKISKNSFTKISANTTINNNLTETNFQIRKTSRPSSNKVNYGERLYHKGLKLKEKTKKELAQKKNELENKNKTTYSFRPKINPISFSVLYKRMTTHTACTDETNIINYQTFRNEKLDELNKKYSSKNQDFTFKPKINKNSLKIAQERAAGTMNCSSRYNKLYNDTKRIKTHIDSLSKQFYDNNLFKPKINTHYSFPYQNIPFEERQNVYQSKSKEKKEKLVENILTEETKGNFTPEINQTFNSRFYTDVFNDLYNKAEVYKQRKLEIANRLYSNKEKVKANQESNQLLNKKKTECFKELFHLMDKNKSGLITKSNIDFSKVPKHINRIFERIVKELEDEDQTLNEFEFVSVCMQLYDYLDYPDKKLFLELGKKNSNKNKKIEEENKKIFTFRPKINKSQNK